jgi:SAM-dependent methyltransferase
MRGYDPRFFEHLAKIEDRHFWCRTRHRLIEGITRDLAGEFPPGSRILELGCGNGTLLRFIEAGSGKRAAVFGMDLLTEPLIQARRRYPHCRLLQADLYNLPFAVRFQAVGLFDVLEHLENDEGMLRTILSMLAPGGVLFMTVPAHMRLWSYFDEASLHFRRYDRKSLQKKIEAAGFQVEYMTEIMSCLYPLVWAVRKLGKLVEKFRRSRSDAAHELAAYEFRIIPVVNGLLCGLLWLEVQLIKRRVRLPLGTSILVLARAPGLRTC